MLGFCSVDTKCVHFIIEMTGSGVMCSQCDSDLDPYCVERPPAPQNCTLCGQFDEQSFKCTLYHEVQYCITERRYMNGKILTPFIVKILAMFRLVNV